jgi:hypothetical protein
MSVAENGTFKLGAVGDLSSPQAEASARIDTRTRVLIFIDPSILVRSRADQHEDVKDMKGTPSGPGQPGKAGLSGGWG